MGAWGTGIKQDDLVLDLIGDYESLFNEGEEHEQVKNKLLGKYESLLDDPEEGPLLWIALAECQWNYGVLEPEVFQKVEEIHRLELERDRWVDGSAESKRLFKQRQQKLKRFVTKLSTPKAKPKKRQKKVIRRPKFKKGDCLSLHLRNGKYGAALVLAENHDNPEYGKNLIVSLDYMGDEKPTLSFFKRRKFLYLTHSIWGHHLHIGWHLPVGFRPVQKQIEVIGNIPIRRRDPKDARAYHPWNNLFEQVVLEYAHRGKGRKR